MSSVVVRRLAGRFVSGALRRPSLAAVALATLATPSLRALCAQQARSSGATVSVSALDRTAPSSAAVSPLDRVITVALDGAPLAEALADIADRGGVRLSFRQSLVAGKRVSVGSARLSVRDAFAQVLRGTGMRVTDGPNGSYTLLEMREPAVQGGIQGKVIDAKTRKPIVGATILLDDATKGITSDEQGLFRLSATPGEHTVHVRYIGFTRQSVRVTVTENASATVEVQLQPSASVLDEVVVTGSVVATERKAIPTPITVIKAEDIEKRGITRIEQLFRGAIPGLLSLETGTMRFLANQPGLQQTSQIYSRGSANLDGAPNPIKTYVDGVELTDASYLGTIDPQSIERIEVITGPQAATIYGSGAMGGVMQIFTKRGNGRSTPDITVNMRYGTLESNLSSARAPSHNHTIGLNGGSGPDFSYSANLSYQYTGQWQPELYVRTSGASVGAVHTRGPFKVDGSFSLTMADNGTQGSGGSYFCNWAGVSGCFSPLTARLLAEEGGFNLRDYKSSMFISQQINRSNSQIASMNVDYRATSWWQHHATVGRSQTALALQPVAPMFQTPSDTLFKKSTSDGYRTTLQYNTTATNEWGSAVTTTAILGMSDASGQRTSVSGCITSKTATGLIGCSSSTAVTVSNAPESRSTGGFGSVQIGFFRQLFFTGALRGERNPDYGTDHAIDWTPTVGATYTLERGDLTVKFLSSYGRSTRPPSPSQRLQYIVTSSSVEPSTFLSQMANPDLRPEYSSGPQGGVEIYYGNLGSLTINRYRQNVDGLIQGVPMGDSTYFCYTTFSYCYWGRATQYQNIASIRQQGWESTASLNLGPLALKGTYSWTDSRITATSPTDPRYTVGDVFGTLPTHTGNMTATYAHGGSSVTFVVNYVGSSTQQGDLRNMTRLYARFPMYIEQKNYGYTWFTSPGYAKSDLNVSHRVTSSISATLNITNLTNNFGGDISPLFPSLGRTMMFGATVRFPKR